MLVIFLNLKKINVNLFNFIKIIHGKFILFEIFNFILYYFNSREYGYVNNYFNDYINDYVNVNGDNYDYVNDDYDYDYYIHILFYVIIIKFFLLN
jgi:hypothetical protein